MLRLDTKAFQEGDMGCQGKETLAGRLGNSFNPTSAASSTAGGIKQPGIGCGVKWSCGYTSCTAGVFTLCCFLSLGPQCLETVQQVPVE